MARLDDTCLLHRAVPTRWPPSRPEPAGCSQRRITTAEGRQRLSVPDQLCCAQGLSPGGAEDLLAARYSSTAFTPKVAAYAELDLQLPGPGRRGQGGARRCGGLRRPRNPGPATGRRPSRAGTRSSPWYFLGYANWNYFTTPFLFSYPGWSRMKSSLARGRPDMAAATGALSVLDRHPQSRASVLLRLTGLQRRMDYVTEVLVARW